MMPILTWEYRGVDVIQLARNKTMPEVIKVKNMDGVVCRYIPERTCHDDGDPRDFCCSECGARMFTDVNDTYTMIANDEQTIIKHPYYCPNCGAKVVK